MGEGTSTVNESLRKEVLGDIGKDLRRLWNIRQVRLGLLAVVAIVVLIVVLTRVFAPPNTPNIVGTWTEMTQDGNAPSSPVVMTFAADGSGTIGTTSVRYALPDASHLVLNVGSGVSITSDVAFVGNHMMLTNGYAGAGHVQDYVKQ